MNQGVLEQVDTPQKVYRYPDTAFVASFLGDVNLLAAEVLACEVKHTGVYCLTLRDQHGQQEWVLDSSQRFEAGERVNLALRPENIQLTSIVLAPSISYSAQVERIEYRGSQSMVVVRLNEQLRWQVLVANTTQFKLGEDVALSWTLDDLHILNRDVSSDST